MKKVIFEKIWVAVEGRGRINDGKGVSQKHQG